MSAADRIDTRRLQRGLSLVELMIGVALGLVIVGALIGFFANTSRNNRELAQANRQIEAGRIAIQLLESDVVHAGFWGSYVPQFDDLAFRGTPSDVPKAVPSVCLAWDLGASPPSPWSDNDQVSMLGIPAQAYDGTPTGCASTFLPDRLPDTDVLVVRYGSTCEEGESGCDAGTAPFPLRFQSSECYGEINNTPPQRFVFGTSSSAFTLRRKACRVVNNVSQDAPLAPTRRVVSHLYYVRTYANAPGDGLPTLMRSEMKRSENNKVEHVAPVPLVEGIEGFVVELGIDDVSASGAPLLDTSVTPPVPVQSKPIVWQDQSNRSLATNRGDGSPDRYVRCTTGAPCSAFELMNVVSVRLHILARSLEKSPGHRDTKTYQLGEVTLGPYDDGIKRHVFTTLLRLHNVSGRR